VAFSDWDSMASNGRTISDAHAADDLRMTQPNGRRPGGRQSAATDDQSPAGVEFPRLMSPVPLTPIPKQRFQCRAIRHHGDLDACGSLCQSFGPCSVVFITHRQSGNCC
jgi:hypothetical protein